MNIFKSLFKKLFCSFYCIKDKARVKCKGKIKRIAEGEYQLLKEHACDLNEHLNYELLQREKKVVKLRCKLLGISETRLTLNNEKNG